MMQPEIHFPPHFYLSIRLENDLDFVPHSTSFYGNLLY